MGTVWKWLLKNGEVVVRVGELRAAQGPEETEEQSGGFHQVSIFHVAKIGQLRQTYNPLISLTDEFWRGTGSDDAACEV